MPGKKLDRTKPVDTIEDLLDKYGTMSVSSVMYLAANSAVGPALRKMLAEMAKDLETALTHFSRSKK